MASDSRVSDCDRDFIWGKGGHDSIYTFPYFTMHLQLSDEVEGNWRGKVFFDPAKSYHKSIEHFIEIGGNEADAGIQGNFLQLLAKYIIHLVE